ncbi:hypothetical protein [Ramlibacter alkalitolerans]
MAAASMRTVRHLRLRAGSETAVRRMLPVLEDAVRCASMGDEGGRLLVVRRLALGRLPPDISAQALSRHIEQRVQEAARQWVDAADPAAESAACVAFAGALQARVQLALRLVRGQPCTAWYWPRAVAEFEPAGQAGANLSRMAWTIAAWPEARVALPAWATAVASEPAGAARLGACMPADAGEALVRRAGVSVARGRAMDAAAEPAPSWSPARPPEGGDAATPEWLRALRVAAGPALPVASSRTTSAVGVQHEPGAAAPVRIDHDAPVALHVAHAPTPRVEAQHPQGERFLQAAPTRPAWSGKDPSPSAQLAQPVWPGPARQEALSSTGPAAIASHAVRGDPFLAPTACGGLLFLLAVVQRLGLPDRLPGQENGIAAGMLGIALQRLRVPADDPAWPLAATCGNPRDEAASHAWLAAARAWLRHAGRIGLGPLVLRPAQLALTATHADVHFDLARTDLNVRRLGLDLDLGWVPWFGRVVNFHYGRGPA